MGLVDLVHLVEKWIWGWPLILFVVGVSVIWTVALRGVQFRCLLRAWRGAFALSEAPAGVGKQLSPRDAFINTLSANLGNSALAGMATAVAMGGPGAGLWAVIIGLLLMAIRFAEVYTSTEYGKEMPAGSTLGGPMLYLRDALGGRALAYAYGMCALFFGMALGNAAQANSILLSVVTTWDVHPYIVAAVLVAFVVYVVLGGAARVIKISDKLVPVKVALFFIPSFLLLFYHYATLWSSLKLICLSALAPSAIMGGALGYTVQQALRYGMDRSIMATESGLGTSAILFGFTGSKDAFGSALMGMLSTFISTCVCFMVVWCIVASGVWQSGLTSTALNIAAFETLFGSAIAGWLVTFLSTAFGVGLIVTYAYVMRAVWLFLTGGRWLWGYVICYCLFTAFGALATVEVVWSLGAIANGGLLATNLFGLLCLLPKIAPKVCRSIATCGD